MKWLSALLVSASLFTLPAAADETAAAPAEVATYAITFASTWSEATHPGFPPGAHFSPLIGATHNVSATFWLSGTLASPGMERMAETGATMLLADEFTAAGSAVHAIIAGPGLGASPGQVSLPFVTASRTHPLVMLVTMIAPSPDWFVGVEGLSLLDETGDWRDQIVVALYPYDAGTDDGVAYTSPDSEPDVHQPVSQVSGSAPFSAAPIGILTFTRIRQIYMPIVTQ